MKTIILLLLLSSLSIFNLAAQTNYYTHDKTFYEDGYTYQCDVDASQSVTLYNKNSKYIYIEQINRYTGEKISTGQNRQSPLADDSWTKPKCFSIVNNAFSPVEKQRIKGNKLTITMYIDPDNGKVADVEFIFVTFNPYATIPLSVYREIETEIKKNIWFTVTDDGKRFNYIMLWWRQEPK